MRRSFATLLLALLLAGCATEKGIIDKGAYELDTRHQAQAAYPRIKVLVIHYTADDFDSSLATLTDKNVSSHYLIPAKPPAQDGKPRIWQLVPESELAWHAGISFWRGTNRINDTSVGIELENRGWQKPPALSTLPRLSLRKLRRWCRSPETLLPATTSGLKTWWPIRTSLRSAKTIPVRCSRGTSLLYRALVPGPNRRALRSI